MNTRERKALSDALGVSADDQRLIDLAVREIKRSKLPTRGENGDLPDDATKLIDIGQDVRDAFGDDPTEKIRALLWRAGLISAGEGDPWYALADGLEGVQT